MKKIYRTKLVREKGSLNEVKINTTMETRFYARVWFSSYPARSDDLKKFHDAPMKVSIIYVIVFESSQLFKTFFDKEKRTDTNYFKGEIVSGFLCNRSKNFLQSYTFVTISYKSALYVIEIESFRSTATASSSKKRRPSG